MFVFFIEIVSLFTYHFDYYEVIWNFIFKQYNIYFLASISVLYYLKILWSCDTLLGEVILLFTFT